jgi:hypothetical protein
MRPFFQRRSGLFANAGWMETFVFSQFLLPAVLFLPGAQSFRIVVRTLPYLFCALLLPVYHAQVKKVRLPTCSRFLIAALLLLVLELLHPQSALIAGIAQCCFQLCIALPLYWGFGMVQSAQRLRRLLWLILLANGIGAGVGLLQAVYPQIFLPRDFSAGLSRYNPNYLEDLSYTGANGQKIVRPPGLSDLPGNAAVAGLFAGVLGLALASDRALKRTHRFVALACAFAGITDIYLAQVRSLLLVLIVALALFGLVRHYRIPVFSRIWLSVAGIILVCGTYYVAVLIGGAAISDRFLSIKEQGVYESYKTNRGAFVEYTFQDQLGKYPLGAGIGRWGMMNSYFGDKDNLLNPALFAEIQITGWLYDGGILLWLFYGGAIAVALLFSYRVATRHPDMQVASLAKVVFVLQLAIAGATMAGPVFNTPLGVMFWLMASALYGAASFKRPAVKSVLPEIRGSRNNSSLRVPVSALGPPRSNRLEGPLFSTDRTSLESMAGK